jgi:predicted O-methyltransferase YrrM
MFFSRALQRIRHYQYRIRYSLPTVSLDELLRGADLRLDLRDWDSDPRAGDFHDSVVFAAIVSRVQPQVYWEIGTGFGRSALLAAQNSPADGQVYTICLDYITNPQIGRIFKNKPEAARIHPFSGTSQRFDFQPWKGRADLVFVDGGHEFEDVRNDCEVAFRLVSDRGWIVWHDVARDTPGVAKALLTCRHAEQIRHIAGTRYAIYRSSP